MSKKKNSFKEKKSWEEKYMWGNDRWWIVLGFFIFVVVPIFLPILIAMSLK